MNYFMHQRGGAHIRFMHRNILIFCAHLTDKVKQCTACSHNIDIAIVTGRLTSILQLLDVSINLADFTASYTQVLLQGTYRS